jgi:predicted lysophospholipase L1 biosynthesis ABC-type transport system permease subunit
MAKEKAKTIEQEFEQAKNEANTKLEQARNQLDEAKDFLLNLDNAKWYVQGRDDALLGFEAYGQMTDRMAAISLIFPWFFFIVAALVCLNTMTRMIEEERTRIGTFKALGFTDKEIMAKYLIFAFSASTIGSVAGSFLGFVLFPVMFSLAFGIIFAMYLMSAIASLIPAGSMASLIAFAVVVLIFAGVVYSLTKNSTVAGITAASGAFILAGIYFINSSIYDGLFAKVLNWLSVFDRFSTFTTGLFDLTSVVYYATLIVLFVFATVQSVEKRRWS